jgi:hypothetical protein
LSILTGNCIFVWRYFRGGLQIPQTADSLGRTLDNLGKDIRTFVSGVAGVGDSAEVYAVAVIRYQKNCRLC